MGKSAGSQSDFRIAHIQDYKGLYTLTKFRRVLGLLGLIRTSIFIEGFMFKAYMHIETQSH